MTPTRVVLTAAVVTAAGLGFVAVSNYIMAAALRSMENNVAPNLLPWVYLVYVLFAALPLATVATAWPLGKRLVLAAPLFYLAALGSYVVLVLWVVANRQAVARISESLGTPTALPAADPLVLLPLVGNQLGMSAALE